VLVRDGLHRFTRTTPICFSISRLYNENAVQPPMPEGVEEGIVRGIYLYARGTRGPHPLAVRPRERSDVRSALDSQVILGRAHDVGVDVGGIVPVGSSSATTRSDVERWNRCTPKPSPRVPFVTDGARQRGGPRSIA